VIARRRVLTGAALAALTAPFAASAQDGEAGALERVKKRGSLVVAVYEDYPPFNVGGKGIDVEVAAALAAGLGVKLALLPFTAGEKINDDLRAAVWRGHFLGWGPADVMLHVPMDRELIEANPQVEVVGPYYRERVMLAWDRERGPAPRTADDLRGQPVAVAGVSLAGWLLAGAEGGALRDSLSTQHADGVRAAHSLLEGKVAAAAGLASELESTLAGQPRYEIVPLPSSRAPRNGWVIGCAVKRGSTELARAVHDRLAELGRGAALSEIFRRAGVTWRA
jgi:ABC-type amino acid transport substrate-binding protein